MISRRAEHVAHEMHQLVGGVALRHLQQRVLTPFVGVSKATQGVRPESEAIGVVPRRVLRRPGFAVGCPRRVRRCVPRPRVVELVAQDPIVDVLVVPVAARIHAQAMGSISSA